MGAGVVVWMGQLSARPLPSDCHAYGVGIRNTGASRWPGFEGRAFSLAARVSQPGRPPWCACAGGPSQSALNGFP